jgi:hypothetical protein
LLPIPRRGWEAKKKPCLNTKALQKTEEYATIIFMVKENKNQIFNDYNSKQEIVSITYEEIGFFPRSFSRVLDRFLKQVFSDVENLVIQEYRFYRYLFLTTLKCLLILFFVPFFVNFFSKNYLVRPLTEYFWNTQQNEIFLNSYQQKRAFSELKDFEEKIYFESLINLKDNSKNSYASILTKEMSSKNLENFNNYTTSLNENEQNIKLEILSNNIGPASDKSGPSMVGAFSFLQWDNPRRGFIPLQEKKSHRGPSLSPHDPSGPPFPPPEGGWKVGGAASDKMPLLFSAPPKGGPLEENKSPHPPKGGGPASSVSISPRMQGWMQEAGGKMQGPSYEKKSFSSPRILAERLPFSFLAPPRRGQALRVGAEKKSDAGPRQEITGLPNGSLFFDQKPAKRYSFEQRLQEKTIELALRYNNQSIEAITNFFADLISFITLCYLLFALEIQINITKSFLLEVFFGLDDSKKSLLILLITDLLVGYHSSNLWELFFEFLFTHYGLPESQTGIFLLVATLPVLLDVLFKYLIFRHLNRSSPATVATYHAMIE